MKKMMLFVFGLMLGVLLPTVIKTNTVDVEAVVESAVSAKLEELGATPFTTESNEILISLNSATEEPVIEEVGPRDGLQPEHLEESEVLDDSIVEEGEENLTVSEDAILSSEESVPEVVVTNSPLNEVSTSTNDESTTSKEDEILSEVVSTSTSGVQPLLVQNPTQTYLSEDLNIWIEKVQTNSQRYFWVEIENHSAISPLKRALANGLEPVSTIAARQNAILAINASGYYSHSGEVMGTTLANGSYAENTWTNASPMVIGQDDHSVWTANRLSVTELVAQGGASTFTFGPTLVEKGQTLAINTSGIGSPTGRHPRTVIGRTNAGRWFFLIVDGRTAGASGMTLYEIQDLLTSKGISYAYNLDGGVSTTLYFRGEVLNTPSDGAQRCVPDIAYFN